MSDIVIQVENLSKQYRLGEVSTGSLHHDINRLWHRLRGLPDPYLSVTGENIRTRKREAGSRAEGGKLKAEWGKQKTEDGGQKKEGGSRTSAFRSHPSSLSSDYVWALRDINFEVKRGEVLGIIGRNGAGKSTLLKILSRITAPTTGEVRIKGRIGALLEVGTGFHQDLTGRENIYLNGAILGMPRVEIASKLDEIIEFSGCTAYLDTPVKRYSSGMVVRLAFAVAAHLEPEILIVDEVLAVGDAEFQRKCLGKMSEVASEGRTVLFVSHNLAAVQNLCQTAVWLDAGTVALQKDRVERVVSAYEQSGQSVCGTVSFLPHQHRVHSSLRIDAVAILDQSGQPTSTFKYGEPIHLQLQVACQSAVSHAQFGIAVRASGLVLATLQSPVFDFPVGGKSTVDCEVPGGVLLPGMFGFSVGALRTVPSTGLDYIHEAATFYVSDMGVNAHWVHNRQQAGVVTLASEWRHEAWTANDASR